MARQPKGTYPSVPEKVVDLRPPVLQKPLSASAISLLEFYYRLNTFVMATDERAPVEWVAKRILGVRKVRAYEILREIEADGNLQGWFRRRALAGMGRGRIGRGRETSRSPLADAFFIALAGGEAEAKACLSCLAGTSRVELPTAAGDDCDEADAQVRDYMVHSRLLWRL
jgi:hypothetical protein